MLQRSARFVVVALAVVSAVGAAACSSSTTAPPDRAEQFLIAELMGTNDFAASQLTPDDRDPYIETKGSMPLSDDSQRTLVEALDKHTGEMLGLEVTDRTKKNDRLTLTAEWTHPKKEVKLTRPLAALLLKENPGSIESKVKQAVGSLKLETRTDKKTFEFAKTSGEWYLVRDIAERKKLAKRVDPIKKLLDDREYEKARQKYDALVGKLEKLAVPRPFPGRDWQSLTNKLLLKEAEAALETNRPKVAVENFERVLKAERIGSWTTSRDDIKKDLKKAKAKLAAFEAAEKYRKSLSLEEIRVEQMAGSPNVVAKLKNSGSRTVRKVTFNLKFKDGNGEVLSTESFSETFESGTGLQSGEASEVGKLALGAPSEWNGKDVDLEVALLEFGKAN